MCCTPPPFCCWRHCKRCCCCCRPWVQSAGLTPHTACPPAICSAWPPCPAVYRLQQVPRHDTGSGDCGPDGSVCPRAGLCGPQVRAMFLSYNAILPPHCTAAVLHWHGSLQSNGCATARLVELSPCPCLPLSLPAAAPAACRGCRSRAGATRCATCRPRTRWRCSSILTTGGLLFGNLDLPGCLPE